MFVPPQYVEQFQQFPAPAGNNGCYPPLKGWPDTFSGIDKHIQLFNYFYMNSDIRMKIGVLIVVLLCGIASCTTPGPITGRPDPNVSTSGTLGSVKATDGRSPEVLSARNAQDSARRRRDSTVQ